MKPLLAQDSKLLIVMDDKVKERSAWYYLFRAVGIFILFALTVYGMFQQIFWVALFVMTGVHGLWWFFTRMKTKWKETKC